MATVSMSRDELMEKLLQAKARAEKEDAGILAKHMVEEKAALLKFRSLLKAAMGWDYKKAKESGFRIYTDIRTSCPSRNARAIEVAIAQVKLDTRKGRFHLRDNHDWYRAATWLPESERPKHSVCD